MRTMKMLCRRFARRNPGYECFLDCFDSCRGNYRVYIGNELTGGWYWFTSCDAFRQWARYVLLDG